MTFSIVARDASGAIGSAVCSSSPAVAARCLHLEGGVGGVNSQNVTDPRLGPAILDVLRDGRGAEAALRSLVETADHIGFRQLLVVDATGNSVAYSGTEALGVYGDACGPGVAAGGNMLASLAIPQIMVDAFLASEGELEARLLSAMHSAVEAGGEAGPVHSAGLSVVRDAGWRVTDLRVDWTDGAPISELESLLAMWMLQRDDYVNRGLNPGAAPSYGVPGDE